MSEEDVLFVRVGVFIVALAAIVVLVAIGCGLWQMLMKKQAPKVSLSELEFKKEPAPAAQMCDVTKVNWRALLSIKDIEIPEAVKMMLWKHRIFSLPMEKYLVLLLVAFLIFRIHPMLCFSVSVVACLIGHILFCNYHAKRVQAVLLVCSAVVWLSLVSLIEMFKESISPHILYGLETVVLVGICFVQLKIMRHLYCKCETITPEDFEIIHKLNQHLLCSKEGSSHA